MKTSESIKNLALALLKAQTQMGAATKGAKNPFFKSNYADLPTVMEVVKNPLNEAGILVLQPVSNREGKNFITTTLIHADSGEFMQSETEIVSAKQNDPQAFGAAQTYARRFGLQAMLFIPAEDDDGNVASGREVKQTYTPKPKPTPSVVPLLGPGSAQAASSQAQTINVGSGGALGGNTTALISGTNLPLGAIQGTPVNAEFDAIAKPEVVQTPVVKKSAFRKTAKATPVVTETPTQENW